MIKGWLSIGLFLLFNSVVESAEPTRPAFSGGILWQQSPFNTGISGIRKKSVDLQYTLDRHKAIKLSVLGRLFPHTQFESTDRGHYISFIEKYYYQVSLEYLRYAKVKNRLMFYCGAGPALHVAHKVKSYKRKKRLKDYSFAPALTARFGAQYFVHKNIAVRGEYLTICQYGMKVYDWYNIGQLDGFVKRKFYSARVQFIESFPQLGIVFYF